MRRRHLIATCMLVGLVTVVGAAGAQPSFGPFPSYVDDRGVWVLLSNAQWNASATAKAKELRPQSVLISSPNGSETPSLVWAPTCTHDAQRIVLKRRVALPGRPASVMFNLYPQTWVGSSSTPVLTSVVLVVNGHAALTVHSDKLSRPNLLELQLPSAALGLFRLGENVLEVEVARRALPASVAACNRSPRTLVGVAFGLSGASGADLSVGAGKAPVQYVRGSTYQ